MVSINGKYRKERVEIAQERPDYRAVLIPACCDTCGHKEHETDAYYNRTGRLLCALDGRNEELYTEKFNVCANFGVGL